MKTAFKMTLGAAALALAPQIAMAETEVTYSSWFPGSSTLHTKVLTPFFDRVTEGETIRCLFNLGGEAIDIAAQHRGGMPIVALNGADADTLPPCGALWIRIEH